MNPQHIGESLTEHERLAEVLSTAEAVRSKKTRHYSLIVHEARDELGLTNNEYLLADAIHRLSRDGDAWCHASKRFLGEIVGVSRSSVHRMLQRLMEKGLVEAHESTSHLRTTGAWFRTVEELRKEMFTNEAPQ